MPKVCNGFFSKSFFIAMKGQVSLELILAVIVAVMAGSAFSLVGTEIIDTQSEASVRHQLDGIGTSLARTISNAAFLNYADDSEVSVDIPMIAVAGSSALQSCTIRIGGGANNNEIDLIYAPKSVTVKKKFVPPAGMTVPAAATCGGTLTITKP
jgi:hypothetical protein